MHRSLRPARLALRLLPAGIMAALGLVAFTAAAQPTNDNWAKAQALVGSWGSVTNDNTGATAEPGEPSHAGFPAAHSIWYVWTAPADGEVTVDTFGSGGILPLDTVLAVYSGTNLTTLRQVAANDDVYPFVQDNAIGFVLAGQLYSGPSVLRFNASGGTTYFIAVDGKASFSGPGTGTIVLNWAYHSTGVFRFATEDLDLDLFGPQTGLPIYHVSEAESVLAGDISTFQTYYQYNVPGALITVTRVAGSSGRVLLDYATADVTAVGGTDYQPVQGTLVFDDFEMSKSIVVPIMYDGGIAQSNRDFAIVLSNPRQAADDQTPDLSQPRVDPTFGTVLVRILDTDIDPVIFRNFDTNNNFVGPSNSVFSIIKANYRVPEDVNDYYPSTLIYVLRSGTNTEGVTLNYRVDNFLLDNADADELGNNQFPLAAGSDYATPTPSAVPKIHGANSDFVMLNPPGDYQYPGGGTLVWGANDFGLKPIPFSVVNDAATEFNEDFRVSIYRLVNNGPDYVASVSESTVTILFDDQDPPAGSVDEFHNTDFGVDMAPPVSTSPPEMTNPGADGVVYDLVTQTDGKTILVGNFATYDTIGRNGIARMNLNGSLDNSFDPGSGANDFISSVTLTPGGQVIIAGGFTSFNSVTRNRIARLAAGGGLDNSFFPGAGADAAIWSMGLQVDGKVVVGGEFMSYNGTPRVHIARVNTDGSLDTTFDAGTNGPNGTVWSLVIQPDGRILIGGEFTSIAGQSRNGFARLNTDGSLDTTFDPGTGVDGIVYAMALRPDNKIWIGGEFNFANSIARTRFARINSDGSVDLTSDPGTGADNTVFSIAVQGDGTVYVGGLFSSFNGTHRLGFTRLYEDGTVDTGFLDTAYNQFAGLHRLRYTDPAGIVFSSSIQADGNVLIGGSFSQVGGGQAEAKVRQDPNYPPTLYNRDVWTEKKARNGLRNRSNVARLLGGSTPGPGNISLLYSNYTIGENQSALSVGLLRANGTLGYLSANFAVQPGLAQSGIDYIYNSTAPIYLSSWRAYLLNFLSSQANAESRMHSDGFFGTNAVPEDIFGHFWFSYNPGQCLVSVINDNIVQGDRGTTFQLSNPSGADQFYLGAENIPLGGALGRSTAPFTIFDDDRHAGTLGFALTNFYVSEAAGTASVSVVRTSGTFGSVSVQYATANGTAIAGTDYQARSGILNFASGQTNKIISIPIINNSTVQPVDRTVLLRLSAAGGGAVLGISNAVLSIVDDDYPPGYINFASATYVTNESSGAVILALGRSGGSRGTVSVQCGTTNGTAFAGTNYIATTNTLQWNDGEVATKFVTIPLIHDSLVGSNTTFSVVLFNAKVNTTNAPTVLAGATTKSTVTIIDDDYYGNLQFSAGGYLVNENGGYASITVIRANGVAGTLRVNFATADAGAVSSGPSPNYLSTNGVLTFAPGEVSKSFNVSILDDGVLDPPLSNFFFTVNLSGLVPAGAQLGYPTTVPVYILDAEGYNRPAGSPDTAFAPLGMNGDVFSVALQPDGKIIAGGDFTLVNNFARTRIARLNSDSTLDTTFQNGLAGANGVVSTVVLQSNGRILIGGSFTSLNGVNRNRFARLNWDGSLDTSFNPGSGVDGNVLAMAETFIAGNREILVGGSFATLAGQALPGLVRVNDDGTIDGGFNPALNLNGSVYAIAVYSTNSLRGNKIVIGGDFTAINGVARNHIARLNADGTLDSSFDPGAGTDNTVRALAIQTDDRILIAGAFTNFNGTPLNRFARLNPDGTLDTGFTVGAGANDTVEDILIQPDNRIVLVGQFTRASGVTRGRITRLMPDGTVDPAINFGAGADSIINSVALQGDGMMVLGGGFTQYDGQPRQHIARIYGGSLAGAGGFEFTAANFNADEVSSNALLTVRRQGGTAGAVTVQFLTSDGTAVAGINYSNTSATLAFPQGETFQSINVPVRDDLMITPDLTVNLTLTNPSPPSALGDQPVATLTIVNDDSAVSFSTPNYRVNEDVLTSNAVVHVVRQGTIRGTASVNFLTATNGSAIPNVNYTPVTNTLTFAPGQSDIPVKIPVFHTPQAEGDTTVLLQLTNAVNTLLLTPTMATLTIIDVDQGPGTLMFSQTNYSVSEAAGLLPVTIVRTNGIAGLVAVNFSTVAGTALPGVKYFSTNGVLTFAAGETNKTFAVPIINENQVEGNQTFSLILSNATGGAVLAGPTNVPVTIVDDDVGVTFSSPIYVVSESGRGFVTLSVLRQNGLSGVTTVNYSTTDGTAVAGTNYVAANGTLTFNAGETIKNFNVGILHDPQVTGDLNFTVNLSSPTAPAQLLAPSSALVTILDADPGIGFTNSNFGVLKSGTNIVLGVLRTNANTGDVTVNYGTTNGTAIAGVDYVATSGSLTFSNGIAFQAITVPIINNKLPQGDRVFTVGLFNPGGGAQLISPSIASVTITDDVSGLSFSSPLYSIPENGGAATITVVRSSYTNSIVSVNFWTTNGSAQANANYLSTNGVLTFTNGQTTKSFTVPVIDNNVVDGDQTVLLGLSNIIGNGVFISPSAATLNILEIDGSEVVPSGTALTSESGPVNGVIDPGETVGLLFGLRNKSGTNTDNLLATLLATNGVTNPSGAQNYGALQVHGATVSRPFTFRASGTNGQVIAATFLLQDGSRNLGLATFNFTLGSTTNSYTNNSIIVINDFTNATPYPSIISIGGVDRQASKVTVNFPSFTHASPSDVDVLLVSPAGQKLLLMAKCGGTFAVTNVNLTFDDAASALLPPGSPIVSGTYQPTSFATGTPPFPPPAPPDPYDSTLSVFSGSNPNGNWNLFVIDDTELDTGVISNGWSLSMVTAVFVSQDADVGLSLTASTPTVVATSNLTFTLLLTNYGPAGASNIVLSDTLPPGANYVSSNPSAGVATTNGLGLLTWTVPALAKDATAALTLVVQPNVAGFVSNSAALITASHDPNLDNNSASAAITVSTPSADLALGLVGTPNPVLLGNNLTYGFNVTNLGPATATSVSLTDTLPPGVTFVSAAPAAYTVVGRTVTFTNLGNLGSGAVTGASLVVRPALGGTITNLASCASTIIDPLKGNNVASVKTVIEPVLLSVNRAGSNLSISWTIDAVNFNLEFATNLAPPVVWSSVTNVPITSGTQKTVTLPVGSGTQFFRLRGPLQ